jgi:hypothetical protein
MRVGKVKISHLILKEASDLFNHNNGILSFITWNLYDWHLIPTL